MKNIFAIVVIYNVDFFQSTVYKNLLLKHVKDRSIQFLVYDNSPVAMHSEEDIVTIGGYYYYDNNNSGVSTAYNKGASIANTLGNINYLLLLDQDTLFEADYIDKLRSAMSCYPQIDLFVPLISYKSNIPFSPVKMSLIGSHGVNLVEGEYDLKDYSPVNSGACVRLSTFNLVGGYNDRIRLDFADYDFFSRLGIISSRFRVINSRALQSFSNEESDKEKLLKRFGFYLEGAKHAVRNRMICKNVVIDVLKHTLALTKRVRTLEFIKYLIRNI